MQNVKLRFKILNYGFSLCVLIFLLLALPAISVENDPLEMIYSLSNTYESVTDYTALFIKQERMRGILHREENILFKFKKPFSVYMEWLKGPGEDRAILYDPKKNDGKMIINPHGLIGLIIPILYIEPDNPMVKNASRHTIKEAGFGMAIKNLTGQCGLAKKQGDLKIKFIGKEIFAGRSCSKIEMLFPEGKSYYAHRVVVYIDEEYNLPTHTFIYDWKNKLVEKASYTNLKINTGLGEADFDPKNPAYKFKVK